MNNFPPICLQIDLARPFFLGSTTIVAADDTDTISLVLSLKPQASTQDPHPLGNPPHVVKKGGKKQDPVICPCISPFVTSQNIDLHVILHSGFLGSTIVLG